MSLPFRLYSMDYQITLKINKYYDGGGLAIEMLYYDDEFQSYMPFGMLTVNIDSVKCEPDCAFVDTNNNGRDIVGWIVENELGEITNKTAKSGYCIYPEVRFNLDKVREVNE